MSDFFSKVQDKFNKGVNTASAKSKELIESTKINGQIKALQERHCVLVEELGNITLIMVRKDEIDAKRLHDQVNIINGVDGEIKEREDALCKLHEETQASLGQSVAIGKCPQCGAGFSENTKFCAKCGTKVDALPSEPSCAASCPNCKAPIEQGAKFCPRYGTQCK